MKKKFLLIIFFTITLFSCKQNKENSDYPPTSKKSEIIASDTNSINELLGDWESEENSNSQTFSITIFKNKKGELEGQYCAVARNGNKIDCSPERESNIKFLRKEKKYFIFSLYSFFGAKGGEVKLEVNGNKMTWEVLKKPEGEFYCPLKSSLIKSIFEEKSDYKEVKINSENYKHQDITMHLYKNIIDNYGCGENIVYGMKLKDYKNYEVFIVENNCGDFPFKDLISVQDGKIVDKLPISEDYFDEQNNSKEVEIQKTFNIDNYSNIKVLQTSDGHTSQETFSLDLDGKFRKKI